MKFHQDSVHQKLLKSVHFSPSYSKYRKGAFFRHSVYRPTRLKASEYADISMAAYLNMCMHVYFVGSVAQWLGRRSLTGGPSLIYA